MKCRHCNERTASRPRGLCWGCYCRPGVRELYPSTSKYGNRGVPDFNGAGRRPGFATDAPPGSPEKVLILTQRCQSRQDLWHADDATASSPYMAAAPEPQPEE